MDASVEEHDCLGLPRDFGEDFDISCSSVDFMIKEFHLSSLRSDMDRQCESLFRQPIEGCSLAEARCAILL